MKDILRTIIFTKIILFTFYILKKKVGWGKIRKAYWRKTFNFFYCKNKNKYYTTNVNNKLIRLLSLLYVKNILKSILAKLFLERKKFPKNMEVLTAILIASQIFVYSLLK